MWHVFRRYRKRDGWADRADGLECVRSPVLIQPASLEGWLIRVRPSMGGIGRGFVGSIPV